MLALTLAALFTVTAIATVLSLVDSWLRGLGAYEGLIRERALLKAGFVPQVEARDVRLRRRSRHTIASASRPYARHTPLPFSELAA